MYLLTYYCSYILKDFIHLFLERGEGREEERKRKIDVREKHQSVASRLLPDLGPYVGTIPEPTTQACALTWN